MNSKLCQNTRKCIRRLHQAIIDRNLPEVENILSEYFDVDYVCNSKLSSELALETNDPAICEAVFKTGCDLNKHLNNETGDTLLIKAVSENYSPEIIELLLKYGADSDLGNDLNETAIHRASSLGLLETLRILVKHSHYLNRCDTKGQTALFKAVANGFCDVVKILIEAGTDLEWTDAEKRTALICAVESNQVEVVKVLIEAGCDVNARDRYGSTALSHTAKQNNLEILKILLNANALVDKPDSKGSTPFSEAVKNVHLDIISELIKSGCEVNRTNFDLKQTALHKCISQASNVYSQRSNQLKLFELLMNSGAHVNVPDQLGCTPLYQASLKGELEIARKLLETGADIHYVTNSGETMLHSAVVGNSLPLIDMFIEKVDAVNKQNECALYLAINHKSDIEIIKHLVRSGCDLNICEKKNHESPLLLSITKRYTAASKELILAGCNVNLVNNSCTSPLWAACDSNNEEIVDLLLQNASTDINLGYQSTPLHAAVRNKNISIVKKLIQHRCDLNKLNDLCKSALYMSAEYNTLEIAILLIKNGASPSIHHSLRKHGFCCLQYKDPHPHLELEPLFVAFQNDNLKMITILILATYRLPYQELNTLKDIIFRTSYVRDMKMTERMVYQYANFFSKILSKPRNLKELARGIIRECLGQYPLDKIGKMKLPDQLKTYLAMAGLDSVVAAPGK